MVHATIKGPDTLGYYLVKPAKGYVLESSKAFGRFHSEAVSKNPEKDFRAVAKKNLK